MKCATPIVLVMTCVQMAAVPARAGDPAQEIRAAAAVGDEARLDTLLSEHRQLVSQADAHGRTALHMASSRRHVNASRRLLEAGADVNARDRDGSTPLHLVALAGGESPRISERVAMARLLLARGADANIGDALGATALLVAVMKGRDALLPVLKEGKANVSAVDNLGRSALHYAALYNRKGAIAWLVKQGLDANVADKGRNAPLHLAAHRFRADATRALIAVGADVNAINAHGRSPLHEAAHAGHDGLEVEPLLLPVVQMLLDAGADKSLKDKDGHTAHELALHHGLPALARLLE